MDAVFTAMPDRDVTRQQKAEMDRLHTVMGRICPERIQKYVPMTFGGAFGYIESCKKAIQAAQSEPKLEEE